MFIGRERELKKLESLFARTTASLVVCRGRRRIGKSTLIEHFAKKASRFLEFQGVAPREGIAIQDQFDTISEQIAENTAVPRVKIESWQQAFSLIASQIRENERTVLFLDEISWMAGSDKNFAGYLKIAWDTQFKKFPKLVMVLCGSVSSWIDKNILNNTGFVGRISLDLKLEPLLPYYCNLFWRNKKNSISSLEKLKLLSVAGGVPRYLEEILPEKTAEETIKHLCFSSGGLLVEEFGHIFSETFGRKNHYYQKILRSLVSARKTLSQIARELDRQKGGDLSDYLQDLEMSGFVKKEYPYNPSTGSRLRLSRYRISDNYVRFYLKNIDSVKENIEGDFYENVPFSSIIQWHTTLGLQFETLVLNNIPLICSLLSIEPAAFLNAAPYFQRKTGRQESCQIDLLIQAKYSIYTCEIKCMRRIGKSVISDVKEKIRRLKPPKEKSMRTALIYEGRLSEDLKREHYFDFLIPFETILNTKPT